ncbi:hypothetical protein Q8F55_002982 [Vanrija albida]|uniref:F-box domain-containing protein n=1 Tax=Vanrija albida TaxID=181172 RepID=A0ABR3QBF1_9TREE
MRPDEIARRKAVQAELDKQPHGLFISVVPRAPRLEWLGGADAQGKQSLAPLLEHWTLHPDPPATVTPDWAPALAPVKLIGQWHTLADLEALLAAIPLAPLTSLKIQYCDQPHVVLPRFLSLLQPNTLRLLELELHLPPKAVPALLTYLSSPRSAGLEYLLLTSMEYMYVLDAGVGKDPDVCKQDAWAAGWVKSSGAPGIKALLAANTSLRAICRNQCGKPKHPFPPACTCAAQRYFGPRPDPGRWHAHDELWAGLERNAEYGRRARSAALRALGVARVLVSAVREEENQADGDGAAPRGTKHLLDLPREVLCHIVRFASGDPVALSSGQVNRLMKYAEDRGALRRVAEVVGEAEEGSDGVEGRVRDAWLSAGGFLWDGPPEPPTATVSTPGHLPPPSTHSTPHDDHPAGYLQLSFATARPGLGWDDDDDENENLLAPLIAFAQVYRHALREVDVGGVLGHEGQRVPCFTVTWYDPVEFHNLVAAIKAARITGLTVRQADTPASVAQLVDHLDTPLMALDIQDVGDDGGGLEALYTSLARFLSTPRSAALHTLAFCPRPHFPVSDLLHALTPAVDARNGALRVICLRGCLATAARCTCLALLAAESPVGEVAEDYDRLEGLLRRNERRTARVHRAALQVLLAARVVLTARAAPDAPPPLPGMTPLMCLPERVASHILMHVMVPALLDALWWYQIDAGVRASPFRVLSLPPEVLCRVLALVADEPALLSPEQVRRICRYVLNARATAGVAAALAEGPEERVRAEWLVRGGMWWGAGCE